MFFSLFSIFSVTVQAQTASVDQPVRALIKAMDQEDAKAIRAQFAANATQAYGVDGQMKSAAQTKRWLESDIINRKGKVAQPKFTVSGNEVVVQGEYTSTGYKSKANFLFTVENGLIRSWRMRY